MRKVYLDNASTTPLLPEVREAMMPYLSEQFGNPSSLHDWGDAPREAIEIAREQVAGLINGSPDEIIFTASGTESNNFAVKGLAFANAKKGKHIIVSSIEHFSVLYSARTVEKFGFEITELPVDRNGKVNPEDVKKSIKSETVLVSIMHANGEVGTIEPIKEIAAITKEKGIAFHTDAVASAGTIPLDVQKMGVDALSLGGNQFYGPKGAGALWVRKGTRIMPLLDGGIQEGGRRAGTENVPAIVGLGKAAEIAVRDLPSRVEKLTALRETLINKLPAVIERVVVTGHTRDRLPGHASFCIEFIEGEAMLMLLNMKSIAASSGSSCTSKALKASHVLTGMGFSHELAQGSVMFTIGIDNTKEDIDYVIESMPPIVERLRQMSPLYSKYIKASKGA